MICFLRLGDVFNIKMETHGLEVGSITLLHVWVMEDSTRQSLLVEVMVMMVIHWMTCGCWM